jgi:catechol 2,3-dioxygenase-like lactoylglutathione lyase family enzyme
MSIKYAHTNIVSRDWRRLAEFYVAALDCLPVPPERKLAGSWLTAGTNVPRASLQGIHLRLPGWGEDGPTLEIYTYDETEDRPTPVANRLGLGHLAFSVAELSTIVDQLLLHGGSLVGEQTTHHIEGVGKITFVYAADPDGNILELQQWS